MWGSNIATSSLYSMTHVGPKVLTIYDFLIAVYDFVVVRIGHLYFYYHKGILPYNRA